MDNVKRFAEMLNGRTYTEETTEEERAEAMALGIVIVHGYSDDNIEFVGALEYEVGCYDGGTIFLNEEGIFEECECECKYSDRAKEKCKVIKALWCPDGSEFDNASWAFVTDIPHETFDIVEDGDLFCRGIVFDIKSLEQC